MPKPKIHVVGRPSKTLDFERTGRKGRPRRVWVDAVGTRFVYHNRKPQHWSDRRFSRRTAGTQKYPVGSWFEHEGYRSRLAKVWRYRLCASCGQVRYIWEQYVTQMMTRRADGTWLVRSKHKKWGDVKYPGRAVVVGDKQDVTCTCSGSNGVPRKSVVDAMAYHRSIHIDRGRPADPTNPAVWS